MSNNVVMFPGSNNIQALEQKSNDTTYELIASIVHTLNDNGINVSQPEMEKKISSIVILLRALIDQSIGLHNENIIELENLIDKLKKDI